MIILNSIILIFEILYYSLFIRYARNEGNFYKYIILFTITTLILLIVGTNNFISYPITILLMLFGLKYIVKINTSLYDMLVIIIMIIFKTLIETLTYLLLKNTLNIYEIGIIYSFIKIIITILLQNKLKMIYRHFKEKWIKNNFYIRYFLSITIFIYVIMSCIFIIRYYL